MNDRVVAELRRELGDLVGVEGLDGFGRGWTGAWVGEPVACVSPISVEDVATAVRVCVKHEFPLIPQGGNSGLVGGSVPRPGQPAVVLSTRRMRRVLAVSAGTGEIVAEAGVTLGELQGVALDMGWDVGVDFGARDVATVGGMVATNAGGSRVARWGTFGTRLAGVELVDGVGGVLGSWSLAPLAKASLGPAWPGSVIGSEGTLGVVTAARIRCVSPRPSVAGALSVVQVRSLAAALGALRAVPDIDQVEFLCRGAWDVATDTPSGIELQPDEVALMAVVAAADDDARDSALGVLGSRLDLVAVDLGGGRLGAMRDSVTSALPRLGLPLKLDVALAGSSFSEFLSWVHTWAAEHELRAVVFGHAFDANAHVNLFGSEEAGLVRDAVADAVLSWVVNHGGAISAEHGIGVSKARWLPLMMGPPELAARARLRRAFDPHGVMNPGVG